MNVAVSEELEQCISSCRRLLDLQEQDRMEIATCIRGEQLEAYRKMLDIEEEKLQQFKDGLQQLNEAQMFM